MFCENLRGTYPDTKIIVLSPIWSKSWEEMQKDRWPFESMSEHLKALANTVENLWFIDGSDLAPRDTACFVEDLVHPNDIGFD